MSVHCSVGRELVICFCDCSRRQSETAKRDTKCDGGVVQPYKRFIDVMYRTVEDICKFLKEVPGAADGSRLLDQLKSSDYRLQSREEFFRRKQRALAGEEFKADMWNDTFGMQPNLHLALPRGWQQQIDAQRENAKEIAAGCGVDDLSATAGPFEACKDCLAELRDFRSECDTLTSFVIHFVVIHFVLGCRQWVPANMQQLMKPAAFPGAAIVYEYVVSAHSQIAINAAFAKRFYTAAELSGEPRSFRRILEIGDRAQYIASKMKECLPKRVALDEVLCSDSLLNVMDKQNRRVLCYSRRYLSALLKCLLSITFLAPSPVPMLLAVLLMAAPDGMVAATTGLKRVAVVAVLCLCCTRCPTPPTWRLSTTRWKYRAELLLRCNRWSFNSPIRAHQTKKQLSQVPLTELLHHSPETSGAAEHAAGREPSIQNDASALIEECDADAIDIWLDSLLEVSALGSFIHSLPSVHVRHVRHNTMLALV